MIQEKDFETEALRVAEAANKNGLALRLLGALAIRIHCPTYYYLHEDMNRKYTDPQRSHSTKLSQDNPTM
jgi:hypothetical protein